jgi:hypothetical protein
MDSIRQAAVKEPCREGKPSSTNHIYSRFHPHIPYISHMNWKCGNILT